MTHNHNLLKCPSKLKTSGPLYGRNDSWAPQSDENIPSTFDNRAVHFQKPFIMSSLDIFLDICPFDFLPLTVQFNPPESFTLIYYRPLSTNPSETTTHFLSRFRWINTYRD